MKIKCIIIDDEPLAIKVIENHLKDFQNIELVATFNTAIAALPIIEEKKVHSLTHSHKIGSTR